MCRLCFWSAGKLVSALIRLSAVSLSLRAGRVFTTSRLLNMAQTFQLPFEEVSSKYVLVARRVGLLLFLGGSLSSGGGSLLSEVYGM